MIFIYNTFYRCFNKLHVFLDFASHLFVEIYLGCDTSQNSYVQNVRPITQHQSSVDQYIYKTTYWGHDNVEKQDPQFKLEDE